MPDNAECEAVCSMRRPSGRGGQPVGRLVRAHVEVAATLLLAGVPGCGGISTEPLVESHDAGGREEMLRCTPPMAARLEEEPGSSLLRATFYRNREDGACELSSGGRSSVTNESIVGFARRPSGEYGVYGVLPWRIEIPAEQSWPSQLLEGESYQVLATVEDLSVWMQFLFDHETVTIEEMEEL